MAEVMIAQTGATPQMIEALVGSRSGNSTSWPDATKSLGPVAPPDEEL
jgi:hypothetical protein